MTWFYIVSYQVMRTDAPGRSPRPAHEEILENEHIMDNHVIDVLPICQNIMQITREGIKSRLFERGGNDVVSLTRSILTETQNTLGCQRQRRSQRVRIRHT